MRKVCNKCDIEKELCDFPTNKVNIDGHRGYCKVCKNKLQTKYRKESSEEQKIKQRKCVKNWFIKNTKKRRDYMRSYEKERRKNDPLHKLKINMRTRISIFLRKRNIIKNNPTLNIVGCTIEELKIHIENQFIEGMSWDNYGFYGWHVDHRIPLDAGKTENEIYSLCHYTNLQPMWWKENLEKSNKVSQTNKGDRSPLC